MAGADAVEAGSGDRDSIRRVLSRYFAAVDDKKLDAAVVEATFTADARVTRPDGSALVGRAEILRGQLDSFARFTGTHHVSSDHLIDLDGGSGRVRANMTAMHLWRDHDPHALETYFLAGGVLTAVAVRGPSGWRLQELAVRNTWRTGTGMAAMIRTGRTPGRQQEHHP